MCVCWVVTPLTPILGDPREVSAEASCWVTASVREERTVSGHRTPEEPKATGQPPHPMFQEVAIRIDKGMQASVSSDA